MTKLIVTLADDTVHHVTVINPDRLRGEQMAAQLGLPMGDKAPMTMTTLWAWAALRRTGTLGPDVKAAAFLNDVCVDLTQDKAQESPDPTPPAQPTEPP